jgi:hypothetical protein
MDMLGHDDVANHIEPVPTAGLLEGFEEDVALLRCVQKRCALVATEGEEVQVSGLLRSLQSPRHGQRVWGTAETFSDD